MTRHQFLLMVTAILLAALTLRVGAAFWWQTRLDAQSQRFAFGDSESYWVLSAQIAGGRPYEYGSSDASIFRVPLYPMMLSQIVDSENPDVGVMGARALGCVLGTVTVGLVMLLCWQVFGGREDGIDLESLMGVKASHSQSLRSWWVLIAGTLAAVHPGAISMSILVLSEAPFCPLMLSNLCCWQAACTMECRRRVGLYSILAGVFAGLCVLVRPSWLLFLPFACVFQLLTRRFAKTAVMFGLMLLAFSIVMTPWWARSYRITGHFVLTTLQVGASMYDGLHPGATGASDTGMSYTVQFERAQRDADAKASSLDSTFEYRLDKRMSRAAKTWALQNPGEVLRLAFVKIGRIWRPWPIADETSGTMLMFVSAGGMLIVVLPAIVGLWRWRRLGWKLYLLAMPAIYFTCLHSVFIGSMRYRLPAVLVLSIVAAPVWADWAHRLRRSKSSRGEPSPEQEAADG